jgi:hypothetical protein
MDEKTLNPEIVDALINIIPNEQEAHVYLTDKTLDRSKMAIPDLFYLELVKIPAYDNRLYSLRA